jgi:LacI family transcriptional regulator
MLIENGHRKIAFIGRKPVHDVERDRYEGYIAAMHNAFGDAYLGDIHLVKGYSFENGYMAARDIFESGEKPTAIYTSADILAVGVLQYLYEKNIRIPDDISMISFDNTYSSIIPPKLTTVANHFDEIGKNAVEMIVERIKKDRSICKTLIIDPYIIDRGSVKNIR